MKPWMTEGIFRGPRLKTNQILRKFSGLFYGKVINVSGSSDSDKECGLSDYYFFNPDAGNTYKNYFINASSYTVSNYPLDKTDYCLNDTEMVFIDLESEIESDLVEKFDVVYCHTVFEHIFDIFTAFTNLCALSNDVVIFVVPQVQKIHDYDRGYKDYWRFTPFSVDKLFEINGFTVVYRETTIGFSESSYLFYIASKNPDVWEAEFEKINPVEEYINSGNDGSNYTLYSKCFLYVDRIFTKKMSYLMSKYEKTNCHYNNLQ